MNTVLYIIIAYLLGSIQTGLWIGKFFYHTNLREHGSGNTGTTNTFRVLGKRAGIVTLAVDILKGTLATLLPIWLGGTDVSPLVIGFFAVLGHTFPIFAGFKGGKAVATSAGVLLGFAPIYLIFLLAIFLVTFYLTSMISFSSVTAAVIGMGTVLIFPYFNFIIHGYDILFTILILGLGTIIIVRHRDNIVRIKNKEESTAPFGLNLTHQKKK